jgi:hypothetical protein
MSRLFIGLLIAFIAFFVSAIKRGVSSSTQRRYEDSRYREEQRRFQQRSSQRSAQSPPPMRSSTAPKPPSSRPADFAAKTEPTASATPNPQTPQEKQAAELAAQSRVYIAKIRDINEKIPDPEMSAIIEKVEQVTVEIFNSVRDNPDNASVVRRFLSYYLPTSLKLLETYVQYDTKQVQTPNITQTKQKIKDTLNLLLDAFYKLHDSMYEVEAMDVMNEITAMESILSQEGLISNSEDDIHNYFEKGLM